MKRFSLPLTCALLASLSLSVRADAATTRYVSLYPNLGNDSNPGTLASPLKTIAAAISASASGDTIVLEDGTFSGPGNVNLDTGGRSLTITSLHGQSETTINCENKAYALAMHSGEGQNGFASVFENITIVNPASTNQGGVIYLSNVNTAIRNCTVRLTTGKQLDNNYDLTGVVNNTATSTVAISGCTFSDGGYGLGSGLRALCNRGRAVVSSSALEYGGVSSVFNGGNLTLDGCSVLYSVVNQGAHFVAKNSTFSKANYSAIITDTSADISNCTFTNNGSLDGNGGALLVHGVATVANCTFTENYADISGAAIANYGSGLNVTNCVFYKNVIPKYRDFDNNAPGDYAGAAIYSPGVTTVQFSTFYQNMGIFNDGGISGNVSVHNSILYKNPALYGYRDNPNDVNPVFVDAANGNLNIGVTSPYAHAGTSVAGISTDRNGAARPDPPSAGAYEPIAVPVSTVTSFSPTGGAAGTLVTITGTNFANVAGVRFNGTPARSVNILSPTSVRAVVPGGATPGPISVVAPGGIATSADPFLVPYPAPTLSSFSPVSGRVGTMVTITGANFIPGTAVKINGTPAASVTVVSGDKLTAVIPAGATTGAVSIVNPGATVTSSAKYTVVYDAPIMSSFSPVSGPVGTTITINGANFITGASVKINGTAVTSVTVVSANKITAVVAAGTTTGKVALTTFGGTVTSSASFKVTP